MAICLLILKKWQYDFDGVSNKLNDFISKSSQHLFVIENERLDEYYKFIPFMKGGKLMVIKIRITGDKISAEVYENPYTKKGNIGAFKDCIFYPEQKYKAVKKRKDLEPIFNKILLLAEKTEYKHNIWNQWYEVIKDWSFNDFKD